MKTYSYEKCQSCLVKACCSKVCKEYKQYIFKVLGFKITQNSLPLDYCEQLIGHKVRGDQFFHPDLLLATKEGKECERRTTYDRNLFS
jgi:hypothetical protein